MKKILSLLVLLVAFTSCEEDIKFNDPAVQGLKDNELWRATSFTATRGSDLSFTLQATNGVETLTLKTASIDPAECAGSEVAEGCIYTLGQNEVNTASYVVAADGIEMAYRTGTNMGEGQILIKNDTRDTNLARGFVSGTFYFYAYDDEGTIINFQEGVFYKVPVTIIP